MGEVRSGRKRKSMLPNNPNWEIRPLPEHLLPPPRQNGNSGSKEKMSNKKTRKVFNFGDIQPLKFTAKDMEEPEEKAAKKRKVDHSSVRKGLFSSVNPTNATQAKTNTNKIPKIIVPINKVKKTNWEALSPLIDMDSYELMERKSEINSVHFKFGRSTPQKTLKLGLKNSSAKRLSPIISTPPSLHTSPTDEEFLELEKKLQTPVKGNVNDQSPISAVCNLLKTTNLNNDKSQVKTKNTSAIMDFLYEIEEKQRGRYEAYKLFHKKTVSKIMDLLNQDEDEVEKLKIQNEKEIVEIYTKLKELEDPNKKLLNDKENLGTGRDRRSERLLSKKLPFMKNVCSPSVSPSMPNWGDLRKSTLKKNLITKSEQSPRTRKAYNLYNSLRCYSILSTPGTNNKDSSVVDSPKSSISKKIQNQCLMLQTPVHK